MTPGINTLLLSIGALGSFTCSGMTLPIYMGPTALCGIRATGDTLSNVYICIHGLCISVHRACVYLYTHPVYICTQGLCISLHTTCVYLYTWPVYTCKHGLCISVPTACVYLYARLCISVQMTCIHVYLYTWPVYI